MLGSVGVIVAGLAQYTTGWPYAVTDGIESASAHVVVAEGAD